MTERTHAPPGGADCHFGVRVEPDRTWTVYHVFSGVPAESDGHGMTGLGRTAATGSMLAMNLRNAGRRNGRITLNAPRLDAGEIEVFEWR